MAHDARTKSAFPLTLGGLLYLSAVIAACGGDSRDPLLGIHVGRTSILLARSTGDDQPYVEERQDTVTVRASKSGYVLEWLGCEFEADNAAEVGDEFSPTTCDMTLKDGRKTALKIGPIVLPPDTGTTLTTFSIIGDHLSIAVVGALTIDGVYYRPSYFMFDGGEGPQPSASTMR